MAPPRSGPPDGEAGVELPVPTSAPLYFALGLALLFAGLVTHFLISVVGLVAAVAGAVGWWREVLPHENEERVPLQPESERARPVEPRPRSVEHLVVGEERHRVRLPLEVQPLSAGIKGGLAGAVAMAVVACTYGILAHGSPWLPINLLAGALLPGIGQQGFQQLLAFDGTAFAVATLMHLTLSPLVGLLYAALLPMLPGRALVWGGLVAPLAWTAVSWPALGLLAPALAEHVSWPWFIASQVAFGLATGAVIARVEPITTLQSLPLLDRAGIEGGGSDEGGDA
jgi:hypothetical protein